MCLRYNIEYNPDVSRFKKNIEFIIFSICHQKKISCHTKFSKKRKNTFGKKIKMVKNKKMQ